MGEQEIKAELKRMGINDLSVKDLLAFRLNAARQEGKGMRSTTGLEDSLGPQQNPKP